MEDQTHLDDKRAFDKAMDQLKTQLQQQIVELTDEIHDLKINHQRQLILAELSKSAGQYQAVSLKDYAPQHPTDEQDFEAIVTSKREKLTELKDMVEHLSQIRRPG